MINQEQADYLMNLIKLLRKAGDFLMPPLPNEKRIIELVSEDGKEQFVIDVNRGRIKVSKYTFQERVYNDVVLIRLDVDGKPHTNPDCERVPCPHIHIYKEGFDTRWAYPLEPSDFNNFRFSDILLSFLKRCNVRDYNNLKVQEGFL